jgi:hypothetical protein
MTLDDFQKHLQARGRLLRDPALRERLGVVAANRVSALVKRRVFRDGIAQDGSNIGQYSTKPGWFTTSAPGLPKLSPKGKPPSNRAKKTIYSETGYKGYRNELGRQSAKVDLNLSGATFNGVGVGVGADGLPAFGIKTKEAVERIAGNEDRFDCITVTPNEQERSEGRADALEELKFILGID